jgi:heme-degrading monooxygenase HmoA
MAPLDKLDGYMGCGLLVDRESNIALSVTYWATAEARQASEQASARIRAQVVGESVRQIEMDRFEEVISERTRAPGGQAFLRMTDLYGVPDKLDDGIAFVRDEVLPVLKQQPAFRAMLVSVNRETGRMAAASIWETAEARAASEASIQSLRGEAARLLGASGARVENFETVYANIKLPGPD